MKKILLLLLVTLPFSAAAETTHDLSWANGGGSVNQSLTIDVGDTVRWTWGAGTHNLRSISGIENFDSGYSAAAGNVFSYTFNQPGATSYQCDPHASNMNGTINVTATSEPPTPPINLSGNIETVVVGQGAKIEPVCAMALASGEFMFSCDPIGEFSLENLPREADGTVVRQIYADGFFPSVTTLTESGVETVTLDRAFNCPSYNLPSNPDVIPASAGKMHSIAGRVLRQATDTPICALVLANGAYVFSCDDEGTYSLEFPLDANGQYKLQVYADGFAPAVQTFNEFDDPLNVRMARSSECESAPASQN